MPYNILFEIGQDKKRARVFRSGIFSFSHGELLRAGVEKDSLTGLPNPVKILVSPDSIKEDVEKIKGLPTTFGHTIVSKKNWRNVAVGDVANTSLEETDKGNNVVAEVILRDGEAESAISSQGYKYFSVGFNAPIIFEKGVDAIHGEHHAIFGDKDFNHLAYVASPRAGESMTFFSNMEETVDPDILKKLIEDTIKEVLKAPETPAPVVTFSVDQGIKYGNDRHILLNKAVSFGITVDNSKSNLEIAKEILKISKAPIEIDPADPESVVVRFAMAIPDKTVGTDRSYNASDIKDPILAAADEAFNTNGSN